MSLRFNEDNSLVPASIFWGACFFLGMIIGATVLAKWLHPEINTVGTGFTLLLITFITIPACTITSIIFHLLKLNRFAITFMPEALLMGAGISMLLMELGGSNWLNVDSAIGELCLYYILVPALIVSILLLVQGLYIRWRRKKKLCTECS